jgi:hypothetical protein
MERLTALRASIEQTPPEYMVLYAIARGLGGGSPSPSGGNRDAVNGAEIFVALFGGEGEVGPSGTIH